MGGIANRFRPKLGADWPVPLSAMLDAVVANDSHNPESIIGRVLGGWSGDEQLDENLRKALTLDALAFLLSERHGGEWGKTYFGPFASGSGKAGKVSTVPPRETLTSEAVEHWRERARNVDHHVARARYSDAAWDLATLVGIKRDRDDAVRAVDSYLGQCVNSGSELHQERCLRRAHELARACGDENRRTNVRTSLFELCRLTESEACERFRFLACDLYLLDKRSKASEDERSNVLNWMEEGLTRCVSDDDPFDGERYFKRLDQHFRRSGDDGSRKRVARAYGGLLEAWAAKGNGMLAMHNYKKAHEVYSAAGLTDEAKAVRAKVESATAQSQDDLVKFSTTIELPTEQLRAFVENIVSQPWPEALHSFVANYWHRRAEFEKQLDIWLEGAPISAVMPLTVMTESGDSVDLKSPAEDRESHVIIKGMNMLNFADVSMRRVLDELLPRHGLTPERLTELTDESPIFLDARRPLVTRAFKAYCMGDYITFLHLGIPEAESALRALFQNATHQASSTSRDSKRWRKITLNQILDDKAFSEFLGEDMVFYLKVVLTHDLGMNMRNLISHGLVSAGWCNRHRADRLLHILFMLSLAVRVSPQDTVEADQPEQDG
jgi:Domain of unknown function (DUF4209)